MKLLNTIYILLLISFIFLWDISFLINQDLFYKKIFNYNLSSELNISFRYLVLFLLFPIFYFLIVHGIIEHSQKILFPPPILYSFKK